MLPTHPRAWGLEGNEGLVPRWEGGGRWGAPWGGLAPEHCLVGRRGAWARALWPQGPAFTPGPLAWLQAPPDCSEPLVLLKALSLVPCPPQLNIRFTE